MHIAVGTNFKKKLLQATQIIRSYIAHTASCSYMETCIVYALCKIAIIITSIFSKTQKCFYVTKIRRGKISAWQRW